MNNENFKKSVNNNFDDLFKKIDDYLKESEDNQKNILNPPWVLEPLEPIFERFQKSKEIDKKYNFSNFKITEINKFAYTALKNVLYDKLTSKMYNPLFIYGKNESDKNHLIHASYNKLLENKRKEENIELVNTENFYLEYIKNKKDKSLSTFKKIFINTNTIIFDNFEFIDSKDEIQEFLFSLFNHIKINNNQVIIFSQIEPKSINMIPQLTDFINSGLFAAI